MGRFSNEGRFRVVGNEWNYRILDTEYSAALEEVDLGGVVPRQLGPAVFRDIGDAHWTASELNGRRFPQEPAQASWHNANFCRVLVGNRVFLVEGHYVPPW